MILQWQNAEELTFRGDDGFIAASLQQRMGEFSKLTKLTNLAMTYDENTYANISAAAFIENLPAIERLYLSGPESLSIAQAEQVLFSTPLPSNWGVTHQSDYFMVYKKKQQRIKLIEIIKPHSLYFDR